MKQQESVILNITDVHYGKGTRSYDTDICLKRMEMVAERVESITSIMKHGYDFTDINLFFLGDLADGAGIYPSQAHHQDNSNAEEQSIEAAELIFKPFVLKMRELFPQVNTYFVPGNHGRSGKHMHEAQNWDVACYRYLSLMLKNRKRIRIDTANIAHPIKVVDVRGHGHLLYHGNEIKSFANIPWYGMMNRLLRWQNSSLPRWTTAHMGHFHSHGRWQINNFEMFSNGTMVTHDEWAFQVLGWESANKWWMMGVSDHRPVTWAFDIQTAEPVKATPGELASAPLLGYEDCDDQGFDCDCGDCMYCKA